MYIINIINMFFSRNGQGLLLSLVLRILRGLHLWTETRCCLGTSVWTTKLQTIPSTGKCLKGSMFLLISISPVRTLRIYQLDICWHSLFDTTLWYGLWIEVIYTSFGRSAAFFYRLLQTSTDFYCSSDFYKHLQTSTGFYMLLQTSTVSDSTMPSKR